MRTAAEAVEEARTTPVSWRRSNSRGVVIIIIIVTIVIVIIFTIILHLAQVGLEGGSGGQEGAQGDGGKEVCHGGRDVLGLVDTEECLTVGMLLRRTKKISKKQGSRECLAMRVIPGELLARQRIGGMVGRESKMVVHYSTGRTPSDEKQLPCSIQGGRNILRTF